MNKILTALVNATLVIISVIILGLLPCSLISMFISIFTDATFKECVTTTPFWIGSVLSIVTACVYISCELDKN